MESALPAAASLPTFEVEHLERPDPGTPLGIKGMDASPSPRADARRLSAQLAADWESVGA